MLCSFRLVAGGGCLGSVCAVWCGGSLLQKVSLLSSRRMPQSYIYGYVAHEKRPYDQQREFHGGEYRKARKTALGYTTGIRIRETNPMRARLLESLDTLHKETVEELKEALRVAILNGKLGQILDTQQRLYYLEEQFGRVSDTVIEYFGDD